ncbi:helix-turn-helix domain-containing protein [Inquilinus sp.]|jgi:DNA-binding IclR family transcriptional regulator|uniref:helix-turn-helix domain-containing protein n=1 Tax=Inquilinus sp. TaxID=1932117 RepID=UPI00378349DD
MSDAEARLRVLSLLASGRGWAALQLGHQLGLSRTETSRILQQLRYRHFAVHDGAWAATELGRRQLARILSP